MSSAALHLLAGQTGQAGRRSSPRSSIRSCTYLIAQLWPQAQAEHAYEASRAAVDQRSRLMAAGASSRRRSSPSQQDRRRGQSDKPGTRGPLGVDAGVLRRTQRAGEQDSGAVRPTLPFPRWHPKVGGPMLALSFDPRSTKAGYRALGEVALGARLREVDIGVIRGPPRSAYRNDHGHSRPHRRDGCRRVRGRRERYVDRRPERGWSATSGRPRIEKPDPVAPPVGLAGAGDSRRPRTRRLRSLPPL